MEYKGFTITPSYVTGSDYRINKHGQTVDRNPTNKDIEYYELFDPMDNDSRFGAEYTIKECKQRIDDLLISIGMKDNKQATWDKIPD